MTVAPGTVVLVTAHGDDQRTGAGGPVDPITWASQPLDDSYVRSHVLLAVEGTLHAVGAPDSLIWFTSGSSDPTASDWVGMQLRGPATLQYCVVEYAATVGLGHSSVHVSHSVFRHLLHNVVFGAAPTFTSNYIHDCGHEVNVRNSSPVFTHNVVRTGMAMEFDCRALVESNVFERMGSPLTNGQWDQSTFRYNLVVDDDWGFLCRSTGVIRGNSIYGNRYNLVVDAGSGPVDVRENWWGTAEGEAVYAGISNRTDRPVLVEPWLEAPHPAVPLPPPTGVRGVPGRDQISLTWTVSDSRNVAGFKIHYDTDAEFPYLGRDAAEGPSPIDVGSVTQHTVSGLAPGETYYLTVSAYDSSGRQSWHSADEVRLTTDQAFGRARGRVRDALTRKGVGLARVVAGGHVAFTDERGRYLVDAVPPGEYVVEAAADAYRPAKSDAVVVSAGAESSADVFLELYVENSPFRSFTDIPEVNIGEGPSVLCATVDDSGHVWLGDFGGGLLRFDGARWRRYPQELGLAQGVVADVAFGDSGTIWLAHRDFDNVSYYDGARWHILTEADGLAGRNAYAAEVDLDGDVWLGFTNGTGVSRFDGSRWATFSREDGLVDNGVYAIAVDTLNEKWFGTFSGISRFDGSRWISYTTADGLPGDIVQCLYVDRDNDIWAGTSGYGTARYDRDEDRWIPYARQDGLIGGHVTSIVQDRSGDMWLGTMYDGVSRFDGTTFLHYSVTDGLVFHVVTALAVDHDDNLWIGTWRGVSILPLGTPNPTRVQAAAATPQRLALSPNYPNPFNSQTVIPYALPVRSRVHLAV
ncbi:MAG: two-component regulator propeller domain-containing protein [Candidatus Latescibacterota bacterium]